VIIEALIAGRVGLGALGAVPEERRVVSTRPMASPRVRYSRSTATGYDVSAKPMAAILAAAFSLVLSGTMPFSGLVSFKKYPNVLFWRSPNSASVRDC